MAKRVLIIASGETERQALPHLLAHLKDEGIEIDLPIRTPPRHNKITAEIACRLMTAAYWEKKWSAPPDKFIILTDADGKDPADVVRELKDALEKTSAVNLPTPFLAVAAKWHLEAWFFGDPASLRDYLGKSLGSVEAAKPDEIQSPKNCLKNLLDEVYTARVAGEIAQRLNPAEVRSRSPSFTELERAVRNGPASKLQLP